MLTGCNDYATSTEVSARVDVNGSTTLDKNYDNVQFTITNSGTPEAPLIFDLGGNHLDMTANTAAIFVRSGLSNIIIRNGSISSNGIATGVMLLSPLTEADVLPLQADSSYVDVLKARASSNIIVENITFSKTNTAVYVNSFHKNVTIRDNTIVNSNRMAIYLDHESTNHSVHNNYFNNNGFRWAEDGLIGLNGRPRADISVDASSGNRIYNNTFRLTNSTYNFVAGFTDRASIELYRNCGETFVGTELVVPRYSGADSNMIYDNTFDGVETGIWFASRRDNNFDADKCPWQIPDKSENNTASSNTFSGARYVIDHGVNNTY